MVPSSSPAPVDWPDEGAAVHQLPIGVAAHLSGGALRSTPPTLNWASELAPQHQRVPSVRADRCGHHRCRWLPILCSCRPWWAWLGPFGHRAPVVRTGSIPAPQGVDHANPAGVPAAFLEVAAIRATGLTRTRWLVCPVPTMGRDLLRSPGEFEAVLPPMEREGRSGVPSMFRLLRHPLGWSAGRAARRVGAPRPVRPGCAPRARSADATLARRPPPRQ
jgi:hypothetical protein